MKKLEEDLKYLKLYNLLENLDEHLKEAEKNNMSLIQILKNIFKKEAEYKKEKARLSRINRAKIPIQYAIETFPFSKQTHVKKTRLLQRHDSLDYVLQNKNLVFIGPTGSGKTGLATSFLINAINHGYGGCYITFYDLMEELFKSKADNSGKVLLNKYSKLACLLIDNMTYLELEQNQISLFFNLIQQRHKKTSTIITTTLGFSEWESFLKDKYLTAAIVDRITDSGHIINLKSSKSLRKEPDID